MRLYGIESSAATVIVHIDDYVGGRDTYVVERVSLSFRIIHSFSCISWLAKYSASPHLKVPHQPVLDGSKWNHSESFDGAAAG